MIYGVTQNGECFKETTERMKWFYLCGQIENELGYDICNMDSKTKDVLQLVRAGSWFADIYINPEGVSEEVLVLVSTRDSVMSGFVISMNDNTENIGRAFNESGVNKYSTSSDCLTKLKMNNPEIFKKLYG